MEEWEKAKYALRGKIEGKLAGTFRAVDEDEEGYVLYANYLDRPIYAY